MSTDSGRQPRNTAGFTITVSHDASPANTLRWARALSILARIRARTQAETSIGEEQ